MATEKDIDMMKERRASVGEAYNERRMSRVSAVQRKQSVVRSFADAKRPSAAIINDAANATELEQKMSVWTGIKTYPKAIGWSVCFSSAIIMEGYDLTVLGSFWPNEYFQNYFGNITNPETGTPIVAASWQAGIGNAMLIGQICGLFIAGIVADKYGFKKVMAVSLAMVTGFIFILFFSTGVGMLLAGELLMGLPLGVFQTLTVTYASEVCPVVLRCYLTTYVNLCWVIGQFIASGVVKATNETLSNNLVFRIPWALQWAFPIPILIGVILAPESPWWLVRHDRFDDAKKSIIRLASKNEIVNPDEQIAMMIHTNELEKEINSGTSYLDCFRGVDLRRTEVACGVWMCQNLCGSGLMGAAAYFYNAAGLAQSDAYSLQLGQFGLGIVGVIVSWWAMTYIGRRTLYVWGLLVLCILVLIVGFMSLAPNARNSENPNTAVSWASGSMILIFTGIYNFTVGPVCYSLVAEMPSTRLRQKTVVLARNFYNICGIMLGVLIPYMLNPTQWNLMGASGFVWGGTGFLCFVWAFFRLPEPKGRTFAELDVLFERRIPARKFKETDVDLYSVDIDATAAALAALKGPGGGGH